jgi:hypothetical protein
LRLARSVLSFRSWRQASLRSERSAHQRADHPDRGHQIGCRPRGPAAKPRPVYV